MDSSTLAIIWVSLSIFKCVRTDLPSCWITDCDSDNRTKGCFRFPPECTDMSENLSYGGTSCHFLVTWQQTYDQKSINFEVYAPVEDELEYVAIAFSLNQKMSNSDVLACLSQDSIIQVTHSYNTVSHINEEEELVGVSQVSGSFSNGILNCNFTRTKHMDGKTRFSNLNRKDFYMLAARGRQLHGRIAYHTIDRYISPKKINYGVYTAEPEPTTGTLTSDVTYIIPQGSCSSNPCHNAGHCSSSENGFICICDDNFTGDRCEEEKTGDSSSVVSASMLIVLSTALMTFTLSL